MRYNRLVQLVQYSKTMDSQMFLYDDFNCWINVVFDLTLFQLIILTSSSQIEASKEFKSELFAGQ